HATLRHLDLALVGGEQFELERDLFAKHALCAGKRDGVACGPRELIVGLLTQVAAAQGLEQPEDLAFRRAKACVRARTGREECERGLLREVLEAPLELGPDDLEDATEARDRGRAQLGESLSRAYEVAQVGVDGLEEGKAHEVALRDEVRDRGRILGIRL